jgi:hypothetical protein
VTAEEMADRLVDSLEWIVPDSSALPAVAVATAKLLLERFGPPADVIRLADGRWFLALGLQLEPVDDGEEPPC